MILGRQWGQTIRKFKQHFEPFARLDDVGLLPNLVRFENTAFLADGTPISFAPFRGLARLRMIGVSIDRYADLDALLDLPALKAVRLFGNAIYDDAMTVGHPARRTLESLKARGVDVRVILEGSMDNAEAISFFKSTLPAGSRAKQLSLPSLRRSPHASASARSRSEAVSGSPIAGQITGQSINVNGGMVMV